MKTGLLGRSLGHSWSPQIHKLLTGADYGLYEIEPQDLDGFFVSNDLAGFNVTIPYKKDAAARCQSLSPLAARLGSVNTVVRQNGGCYGDNTDYFGFCRMAQDFPIRGKKALVLGSGGASVSVCAALADLGAKKVTVISRNGENNYKNLHLHRDAEIIVNTTPVGMYPNGGVAPVSLGDFPACFLVLDVIYNPRRTALLMDAEARGIACRGGLTMLVAQAKRSAELFWGAPIPDARIAEIEAAIARKAENIVLIGMPGCGKTSVGMLLAELLSKPFVDADAEIEKTAGKTIPEIFAAGGEDSFRRLETEILARLGSQTGLVIATGGGCVTRAENRALLRQNGRIVWLARDLAALPSEGRPLSLSTDLTEMYRVREPLYHAFADFTVQNGTAPADAAEKIKEMLP